MHMGMIIDRRTGIGFGTSICFIVLSLLLCALLLVRGALPMSAAVAWLWGSYGLAALFGGRVAAAGQGRKLCAFLPAMLLYALVWLLALSCKGEINFASLGIGTTIAVMAGALLAYMTVGGKRRKKNLQRKKYPMTRTTRR